MISKTSCYPSLFAALLFLFPLVSSAPAWAQSDQAAAAPVPSAKAEDQAEHGLSIKRAFLNLPGDQKTIWLSPFHVRKQDSAWLVPLVGTTALLMGSDEHSMAREKSNASAISRSNHISDGGLVGLAALPAGMYLWGSLDGYPKARETGLLSGEALVNSLVVNEALKVVFSRERPTVTDGQGHFFQRLGDSSFPSTHATLSWTAASVIAHEYPGPLTQALVYGTAATVSIARVTGRQHFPSDVVVGSALGWLVGRQIYRAHHDPELEGAEYGAFSPAPGEHDTVTMGSPYVPLDSWIYPALKRLAALGYVKTQFTALEPWTRRECLRQAQEAEYYVQDLPTDSESSLIVARLKQELSDDSKQFYSAQIDSIYARYQNISGTPLRDSYHFGQTIWDDFGRPYDQGGSAITGAEGSAVAGRYFFYARGEYQHAPGRGPLTDAQRQLIANLDVNPVQPASPVDTIDRFYPIDMYAGVELGQYALTFGKQSLWLGPTESAPLMVSDNADPMYMLRFARTTPLQFSGILSFLGQARGEVLFAKLSGHQFPARPFFNLQKISFHPTQNLEVGFTRSSIWAGVGHPFTGRSLLRNFTSLGDSLGGFGDPNDPGDRKSGLDFSYRIPGLRNWLTLYADAYSDDDPSPLANPRRAAYTPGIYLSHVPGIARLDLRAETTSTQSLTGQDRLGNFFYYNNQYHDANTNKGILFGSPTGRDARAYQGWSTYHFSPITSLQLSYRQMKTSSLFLPSGGTQSDGSARWLWQPGTRFSLEAFVQYERWLIPALRQNAQQNVTGQIELRYMPHLKVQAN